MNSMELSNYLEKVRRGRKLSQEEFVDGIASIRQYQRYRRGESEIPYEKLDQFATKLGIPSKKILSQFEYEKNKQNKLINNFYNAVVDRDLKTIEKLKKQIGKDIIIEKEKKVFYEHAVIFNDYYLKKISKVDLIRLNCVLINYPEILKHEYFTDIEVLVMSSIVEYLDYQKQKTLLERLSELFNGEEFIMSAENNMINSLILMRLSKGYGLQRNYSNVINFCNKGIRRGLALRNYYLFEFFHYYKALAHFELEDFQEYELSLFKCYNALHLEANQEKIERFTQRIEKDFNINYHMFIMKYLKKEIM